MMGGGGEVAVNQKGKIHRIESSVSTRVLGGTDRDGRKSETMQTALVFVDGIEQ